MSNEDGMKNYSIDIHDSNTDLEIVTLLETSLESRPTNVDTDFSATIDYEDFQSTAISSESFRKSVRSFVPDSLIRYLQSLDGNATLSPYSSIFSGVCLIVDISGFTRLSSKFCSKGKRGIDDLQNILNGFMGTLVSIIYRHGGDVMKFAGDALIAMFWPKTTASADAMRKTFMSSILCAWELKDQHTTDLTTHVAIGHGDLCFGIIGGHDGLWECLISGDCISELSECLDEAPSKNVCLSKIFYRALKEHLAAEISGSDEPVFEIDGRVLGSENFLLSKVVYGDFGKVASSDGGGSIGGKTTSRRMSSRSSKLSPSPSTNTRGFAGSNSPGDRHSLIPKIEQEDMRAAPFGESKKAIEKLTSRVCCFVPQPIVQALMTETFDVFAEVREVTTVFMRWDGYDNVKYKDLVLLQKYLFAAQEIINACGGFLRQFLVDDKGCVLIAMWGVPSATFPDNALRAVWSANTLSIKLQEMDMPCSCGITTGSVFCGSVGSFLRQEYAAVGDVVNISARLMGKAAGSIFIDEETYKRLPVVIKNNLQEREPIKVKGKDVPITPYEYKKNTPFDYMDAIFSEETLPIRAVCKESFSILLSYLDNTRVFLGSENTLQNLPSISGGNGTVMINNHKTPAVSSGLLGKSGELSDTGMLFLIVEGASGTGKRRALAWLKHSASSIPNLKIISKQMNKSHASIGYCCLARLFRAFIGEDVFDNMEAQTAAVNGILYELYPNYWETLEKVAYPAMRLALGVQCPLVTMHRSIRTTLKHSSEKKFRVPYRIVDKILTDVFKLLVQRCPVLIILENVHYVDVRSWRVLQEFATFPGKGVFVMSSVRLHIPSFSSLRSGLPTADSDETPHRSSSPKGSVHSLRVRDRPEVSAKIHPKMNRFNDDELAKKTDPLPHTMGEAIYWWVVPNMTLLLGKECSRHIILNTYSVSEVKAFIAFMLKTLPSFLQKDLDRVVYQLTGGHPSWVSEMCEFLKINGVGEFMASILNAEKPKKIVILRRQNNLASLPRDMNPDGEADPEDHQHPRSRADMAVVPRQHPQWRGHSGIAPSVSKSTLTSMVSRNSSILVRTNFVRGREDNATLDQTAMSKLNFLIVCRFAKLPIDVQSVARSASIVGYQFTDVMLQSIIPIGMRSKIPQLMSILVEDRWIAVVDNDGNDSASGPSARDRRGTTKYAFLHALLHSTLYELSPLSLRKNVHLAIARASEAKASLRGSFTIEILLSLSHHYTIADLDPPKAFEYLVKAAYEYLYPRTQHLNMPVAIQLIRQAVEFAAGNNDISSLIGLVSLALETMEAEINKESKTDEGIMSLLSSKPQRTGEALSFQESISRSAKSSQRAKAKERMRQELVNIKMELLQLEVLLQDRQVREYLGYRRSDPNIWQKYLIDLRSGVRLAKDSRSTLQELLTNVRDAVGKVSVWNSMFRVISSVRSTKKEAQNNRLRQQVQVRILPSIANLADCPSSLSKGGTGGGTSLTPERRSPDRRGFLSNTPERRGSNRGSGRKAAPHDSPRRGSNGTSIGKPVLRSIEEEAFVRSNSKEVLDDLSLNTGSGKSNTKRSLRFADSSPKTAFGESVSMRRRHSDLGLGRSGQTTTVTEVTQFAAVVTAEKGEDKEEEDGTKVS